MGYKIACYTLFDITPTGVINRNTPPVDVDKNAWIKRRNTQCNYDTVLQIISLRSQPEIVSAPAPILIMKDVKSHFGTHYKFSKQSWCWMFEFYIQHANVFNNGIQELGTLFVDSDNVPMLLVDNKIKGLPSTLNTTTTLKNIHYTITSYEYEPTI